MALATLLVLAAATRTAGYMGEPFPGGAYTGGGYIDGGNVQVRGSK
jgi:hypothetical protein